MQVDQYNLIASNRKHHSLPIIGSGPLASAPVASAANQNMWYNSTDFGLCKCVRVFENAGTDLVNCGVLPYLENIRTNNLPITLECVFAVSVLNVFAAPVVWGSTTVSSNVSIKVRSNNAMWGNVGTEAVTGSAAITANTFIRAKVSRNAGNMSLCYENKAYTRAFTNTLGFPNESLLIGGHSNSENVEGPIAKVRVYSGYSATCDVSSLVLLDEWDFNQWNGSANGRSLNGYPFVVSDGTPFTAKGYSWIPRSVLQ